MAKIYLYYRGVVSSLGRGLPRVHRQTLKEQRVKVYFKFDPYINVDPGTMSPTNGEVFVTDDGAETDLDHRPLNGL